MNIQFRFSKLLLYGLLATLVFADTSDDKQKLLISDGPTANISFRHPISGGLCLDITGDSWDFGANLILYPCKYDGRNFDNQRFIGLGGSAPESYRFAAMYGDIPSTVCFSTGAGTGGTLQAADCNGSDQAGISFRLIKMLGVESRILLQQVSTGNCVKMAENNPRKVVSARCDQSDLDQHFVVCPWSDQSCGQ